MRKDSIVFGVSGIFFGLLLGWIVGSQQSGSTLRSMPTPAPAAAASAPAPAQGSGAPAVVLDETQVRALETTAQANPNDEAVRVQLGNMFFDAERFADAIKWYEAALKVNPKDANVSTDLGVSYYYSNQADKALAQFEHSLTIDPKHTKTLLNRGIVRAFGKQDLEGAAASWQQVIDMSPDSNEGRAAKQALESLKSAHPTVTPGAGQ
ncbi:MAG: tetratricopeptide repeat protein [Acidobacteria bacterium]|nr:tetratricopeptide repeat protein [Acidobacteriota bacterium]